MRLVGEFDGIAASYYLYIVCLLVSKCNVLLLFPGSVFRFRSAVAPIATRTRESESDLPAAVINGWKFQC